MKNILLNRSIIHERWYNKSHAFVVYTHILIMIVYDNNVTQPPYTLIAPLHRIYYNCGINQKKLLESLEVLKQFGLIEYHIEGKEVEVTIFENDDLFMLADEETT